MKRIIVLLGLVVLVSGCATVKLNQSGMYYTKANIWYESPERIIPVYHKGEILPVGTRVKVLRCHNSWVKFATDNGKEFMLVNAAKYSTIGLNKFFEQYFSEINVLSENGPFYAFSKTEQENIKNGVIAPGMSKEAVLMAYGYPPSHVTPDLKGNQWSYWGGKFNRIKVNFEDNKVILADKHKSRERKSTTADEIIEYKKLMDKGLITKAEYEQKKKQLLGL